MSMVMDWQTSVAASAGHAAERLARGATFANPRLREPLLEPVEQLTLVLADCQIAAKDFWPHLLPHSSGIPSVRQRIEVALTKGVGAAGRQPETVSLLASRLTAVERAFAAELPRLEQELELRLTPWRQLWEARGPGLLHGVRRLGEPSLLPESATVVLVQPIAGGAGRAFAPYNQVLLEALLTDADPRLPEVVRLGWLLAQLNLDLPCYADRLPRAQLGRAARLALVPVLLDAAQETELARFDGATLQLALTAWEVDDHPPVELADLLDTWYGVYRDSRPGFGAALVALNEMLGD